MFFFDCLLLFFKCFLSISAVKTFGALAFARGLLPLFCLQQCKLPSPPSQIHLTCQKACGKEPLQHFLPCNFTPECSSLNVFKNRAQLTVEVFPFQRSLEQWKLLNFLPDVLEQEKPHLGLVWIFFLTQLVIKRVAWGWVWGSIWDFNPYLVLLCGTTELNVISWAEGNWGIAEVLNSY